VETVRTPQYLDRSAETQSQSASTSARLEKAPAAPADFVPLHLETRSHVSTAVMCQHLSRKPQTARGWACHEDYPEGLRPVRVMGRLAWPVSGIRGLLGVSMAMPQGDGSRLGTNCPSMRADILTARQASKAEAA
jgi:hypothetical protein